MKQQWPLVVASVSDETAMKEKQCDERQEETTQGCDKTQVLGLIKKTKYEKLKPDM
jgi:hypothetical protein